MGIFAYECRLNYVPSQRFPNPNHWNTVVTCQRDFTHGIKFAN